MKPCLRLILSGVLLLALTLVFAACSAVAQTEPTPVAEATEAVTEEVPATMAASPVL